MPFLSTIKGCFGLSPEKPLQAEENPTRPSEASGAHTLLQLAKRFHSTLEPRNATVSSAMNSSEANTQSGSWVRPLKPISVETALSKSNSGMLAQHLNAVLQIASGTNTVIGFRPVSWAAKYYIEAGYPSKNFHIKTKSAKWGPQVGLLCPKATEKLDEAHAIKGNLFLSSGRIQELLENGCIRLERLKENAVNTKTRFETTNNFIFYADEPGPEKTASSSGTNVRAVTTHQYRAVKREVPSNPLQTEAHRDAVWDIKKFPPQSNTASEDITVLFCPNKNLPITADYDLLSYARPIAHKNDNNNQTRVPTGTLDTLVQSRRGLKSPGSSSGLAGPSASSNTMPAMEDPDRGNISPFTNQLIDSINQTLARGEGLNMVHHNIEAGNPFANEASCYPAIFCLPGKKPEALSSISSLRTLSDMNHPFRGEGEDTDRWNGDRVVLIKNEGEMTHFKNVLKQHGYHLEVSPTFIGGGRASDDLTQDAPRLRPSHSGML